MNELRRMAYLDAMGVDAYVSRQQLPGAAVTRRLAVTRPGPASQPAPRLDVQVAPAGPREHGAISRKARDVEQSAPTSESRQTLPVGAVQVSRFSLAVIVAGEWLWLEELSDLPLMIEQIHLVEAMAQALLRTAGRSGTSSASGKPDVTQFDWPIHTNRQLALDEEAALAAVTGFVGRKLEQFGCSGLVMLGQRCSRRVSAGAISVQSVRTVSTAEMLDQPGLKPQVWHDLQPLLSAP